MTHTRRNNPFAPDDRDPLKLVMYAVAGAIIVVAAVFVGRILYIEYVRSVVTSAANDIVTTAAKSAEQAAQRVAAAQQALLAKAEADRQAQAQAERDRTAAQQAAVDRAQAEAAAKEAAWKRFYKPTPTCANPDNSALMECANGHLKAKTEFERQWAAGTLR